MHEQLISAPHQPKEGPPASLKALEINDALPIDTTLQGMMNKWQSRCGRLDQYGMQYSRLFANLCNAGVSEEALESVAEATCQVTDRKGEAITVS